MAIKISGTTVIDNNRRQVNNRLTTSVITANTTAVAGNWYYLNAAGITLTLPSSPTAGDQVGVSDISGGTSNIIGRNSSNIMGAAEDLTFDQSYFFAVFTYVDATRGWVFTG